MFRSLFILYGLVLAVSASAQSPTEIKAFVRASEGLSLESYRLRGEWHIGVGHWLPAWRAAITTEEAERLFEEDIARAMACAFKLTPSVETQPVDVRLIVIAVAFNVGCDGYEAFVRFRQALGARDYRTAACELRDSLWARQLPERAALYEAILERCADSR